VRARRRPGANAAPTPGTGRRNDVGAPNPHPPRRGRIGCARPRGPHRRWRASNAGPPRMPTPCAIIPPHACRATRHRRAYVDKA
jgi:hypothetical protein